MLTLRRMAAVSFAATAVMVVAGGGAAQAAPGNIYFHTEPSSQRGIMLVLENNNGGPLYTDGCEPGWRCGEVSGTYTQNNNSEPEQFRTQPGWCTRWEINDSGSIATVNNKYGTSNLYTNIHPGEGYTGTWKVDGKNWDC